MKANKIDLSLNRETLVDKIVNYLEKRILSGDIPPKTKLSETKVAIEFDVSRAPAREALQRLEEMNLICRARLGREVVDFSIDEFHKIYELKNGIEAYAAMLGAFRATEQELKKIQSFLNNMELSLKTENQVKLRKLNIQFHDCMVKCSHNNKLIESFELIVKQVRWASSLSLSIPDRPELSLVEHREIFDAFLKKNGKKVRALMEDHTNGSMERIIARVRSKKENDG